MLTSDCFDDRGEQALRPADVNAAPTRTSGADGTYEYPVCVKACLIVCFCLHLSCSSDRTQSQQRWRLQRVLRGSAGRHSSRSPVTLA